MKELLDLITKHLADVIEFCLGLALILGGGYFAIQEKVLKPANAERQKVMDSINRSTHRQELMTRMESYVQEPTDAKWQDIEQLKFWYVDVQKWNHTGEIQEKYEAVKRFRESLVDDGAQGD